MFIARKLVLALAMLASSGVSGFTIYSPLKKPPQTTTKLFGIRCENKYYQLEEMEDKENATTELFLREDGTVLIGDTDGPLWDSATGYWQVKPGTDDFTMNICKKFKTGKKGSDMGEFEFEVIRSFDGDMTHVGESVAITGKMTNGDPSSSKQEVGFFNMIDATDDRKDKRSDARPGVKGEKDVTIVEKKNDASGTHKGAEGWVIPSGQPQAMDSNPQQTAAANGLPFGWEEHFDPGQNAPYYVDTTTGNTQWERPQGGGQQQSFGGQQQQQSFGGQNDYSFGGGGAQQQQQEQQATATFPQQQQQQQTATDLPPGWEEHFDPGQNAAYYVETATGATQWERPGLQQQQQQLGNLPMGWEEHFDPAQQRYFYLNTLTGGTQWDRPQ